MSLENIREGYTDALSNLQGRPLIQVKLKSGALVFQEDLTALRSFLDGVVEIAENAEIRGTDGEQSDLHEIIRKIWALKRQTPHGKFYNFRDELEEMNKEIFLVVKDYFKGRYNLTAANVEVIEAVQAKLSHRGWKDSNIERRLREIRAAGWLLSPMQGFYKLPEEEMKK